MDTIFELVRRLALLAIFAAFCELLLPRSGFRSYSRMVVGLLVIAMILQPVLELRGTNLDLDGLLSYSNLAVSSPQSESDGLWLQEQTTDVVEQQLAEQIQDYLATSHPDHNVEVDLDVGFDQYGNLDEFRGMEVVLHPAAPEIEPVQVVKIGDGTSTYGKLAGSPELVSSLARHLGLTADKITLWVYTDGGSADGH